VAPSGIDLVCVPTFADIDIDGERRTAIRLTIEDRARRSSDRDSRTTQAVTRDGQYAVDLRTVAAEVGGSGNSRTPTA